MSDKSLRYAMMALGTSVLFTIYWTSDAIYPSLDWLVYTILAWIGAMIGILYFAKQAFKKNIRELCEKVEEK